jgi:hypothetical protein
MPDTGAGATLVVVNVAALKLGLLKLIEHLLFDCGYIEIINLAYNHNYEIMNDQQLFFTADG